MEQPPYVMTKARVMKWFYFIYGACLLLQWAIVRDFENDTNVWCAFLITGASLLFVMQQTLYASYKRGNGARVNHKHRDYPDYPDYPSVYSFPQCVSIGFFWTLLFSVCTQAIAYSVNYKVGFFHVLNEMWPVYFVYFLGSFESVLLGWSVDDETRPKGRRPIIVFVVTLVVTVVLAWVFHGFVYKTGLRGIID